MSSVFIFADRDSEKSAKHVRRVTEILPYVETSPREIDSKLL